MDETYFHADDGGYCIHLNDWEKCEVKCGYCGHPCWEHHEGGHCCRSDGTPEGECPCDLFEE